MPCYDGSREDDRRDRETARKVEAVLCAVITGFGYLNVIGRIDLGECGVDSWWIHEWWQAHQRKDKARKEMDTASKEAARKQAILDSGDYMVLHQMIKPPMDIHATVASLYSHVPPGCETIAPPCPTASGIRTIYYGDVRLVEAFDGQLIMQRFSPKCTLDGGRSYDRNIPPARISIEMVQRPIKRACHRIESHSDQF